MFSRQILSTVSFFILALGAMLSPMAQDEDTGRKPVPCVSLNRISEIEILDNQNIVFKTRSNDYFLNILPYACNGLGQNDSLMFRSTDSEICTVDVITVVNDIGPGFQPGISCGLGEFHPTTPEEIGRLRDLLR